MDAMNNIVDALVTSLKHQDIMKRQVLRWELFENYAVAHITNNTKWLLCGKDILKNEKKGYERTYFGIYFDNVEQCIALTTAYVNDPSVRIFLFDKQGLRIGHIIPYHVKTNIKTYVEAVLKHLS